MSEKEDFAIGQVEQVSFADHMKSSFISYSVDVIAARALPDIRDGLKPVHRRILYTMHGLGLHPNSEYKKCARTVGQALGMFHPHGDQSVYDALVVLAQDFKTKYPLVDGHGNFGNTDGDPAAAMRYTEAKLSPIGELMLSDIEKDTVKMVPNYDESTTEPEILSGLFPALLCNGSSGIAVGMGCSFLPHSAKAIYKAVDKILENSAAGKETDENVLIKIVQAPDFPTGGIITNIADVHKAYKEGNGRCVVRSKYDFEKYGKNKDKESIVVTEIPYGVNKANLVNDIIKLANEDEDFVYISEVRDESDRNGTRVVIELKKDAPANIVVNRLLKRTELQSSLSINHVALVEGHPVMNLTLKELLEKFTEHAINIELNKAKYEYDKLSKRHHIVSALIKALEDIEKTIELVRSSSRKEAVNNLRKEYELDEIQAQAIVDMRLSSLNQEDIQKYLDENEDLVKNMERYNTIINNMDALIDFTRAELKNIVAKYKIDKEVRKTEISTETDNRDIIPDIDVVVAYTHKGFIKSVRLDEYNAQKRNGKGNSFKVKEDDFVQTISTLSTQDDLVFITDFGKAYVLPAYKISTVSKNSIGKSINNYVNLGGGEKIINMLSIKKKDITEDLSILFVTKNGVAKRLDINDLPKRNSGVTVIKIDENDTIVSCCLAKDNDEVIISTHNGFGMRINVDKFTIHGRSSGGVTAMKFKSKDDFIVSASVIKPKQNVFIITENGIGKRFNSEDMRLVSNRGSQGVTLYKPTAKTGKVATTVPINDGETIIITTKNNMIIRIPADTITIAGRAAKGTKIVNLSENDSIASITAAPNIENEEKGETSNE